jgi:hypothetical protein
MSLPSEQMSAAELKKVRTEYNFRKKHGDEGYAKLLAMADECKELDDIAAEFELTRPRISQILNVLLEMPYHVWLANHGIRRKKVTPHKEAAAE